MWTAYVDDMWCLIGIFWIVTSFFTRRTRWSDRSLKRLLQVIGVGAGFALLFEPEIPGHFLDEPLFANLTGIRYVGAFWCLCGWATAVWSRLILGANWSASVSLKQGHALVQQGPYSVVRHPIYSGLLLALLGTALVENRLRGFAGFALIAVLWAAKALAEEKALASVFGTEYGQYRSRTGTLLPRLS